MDPGPANLVALTEGIHSKEALELVREHMLGVMGAAASSKFSTELIKMSKFQMAQVGGTSGGQQTFGAGGGCEGERWGGRFPALKATANSGALLCGALFYL